MNKLRVLLVASALLTAACGGAATVSGSQVKSATDSSNVRVDAGANAGSDISDLNRTNPPLHRPGTSQTSPAATAQSVAPAAGQPSFGSGFDRCGNGIGTGLAGSRAGTPGSGKRHPLPMCAVE